MKARHLGLGAALLATLVAVFWPEPQGELDEVVAPVARTGRAPSAPAARPRATVPAAGRTAAATRLAALQADLFPRQTWVPPPPPAKPVIPPPPPPPEPPPLPFKYLGRWVDAGKETVFLLEGERAVPVTVGQVLPGSWRVESVSASGVVFTYLPLNMQSTMGITP